MKVPGVFLALVFGAGSVAHGAPARPTLTIESAGFETDGRLSLRVSFTADHPIKVYSWRGNIYPILGYYLTAHARDDEGRALKVESTATVIPKLPHPLDVVTAEEYTYPEPLDLRVYDASGNPYLGCLIISLSYETTAGVLDPLKVESNRVTACNAP